MNRPTDVSLVENDVLNVSLCVISYWRCVRDCSQSVLVHIVCVGIAATAVMLFVYMLYHCHMWVGTDQSDGCIRSSDRK